LKKFRSGKVRDVYDLGDELMIVATDRLSAYDVIMPNGIPDKGRVLTQMSLFWYDLLKDVVENHLVTANIQKIFMALALAGVNVTKELFETLDGRTMIVKKAKPYPVECIVRGYISGSAWKKYRSLLPAAKNGVVYLHGIELPDNLKESDKLPQPIFTPSSKAELGEHDENINYGQMIALLGEKDAQVLREKSIMMYTVAAIQAAKRGIIIADTKFEFGRTPDGKIIVIDEVLTPDSSRFWDADTYKPGGPQPSFDKQYVRDWLDSIGFNHQPPAPVLPIDVVATAKKYREAYNRITGLTLG
jgi:phosphoribosylaminoimidazole-succinocarboxamide synthase